MCTFGGRETLCDIGEVSFTQKEMLAFLAKKRTRPFTLFTFPSRRRMGRGNEAKRPRILKKRYRLTNGTMDRWSDAASIRVTCPLLTGRPRAIISFIRHERQSIQQHPFTIDYLKREGKKKGEYP